MLKESFTPEEWLTLNMARTWVGEVVGSGEASYGRHKTTEKEMRALVRVRISDDALVHEWSLSLGDLSLRPPDDLLLRKPLDGLRDVGVIVDAKAPNHAQAFKLALSSMATEVAEAEGRRKVTDEKKAAVAAVSAALGL